MQAQLKEKIKSMSEWERKTAAWEVKNVIEFVRNIMLIDAEDSDENAVSQ